MSNSEKNTVTVRVSWYSSEPTFEKILEAVNWEMKTPEGFFPERFKDIWSGLLPLNRDQPFTGYTQIGPHTHLTIETPSLAKAVEAVELLRGFMLSRFKQSALHITYAGMELKDLFASLETAMTEAERDLKRTRFFLPSKRIQQLRLAYQRLFM